MGHSKLESRFRTVGRIQSEPKPPPFPFADSALEKEDGEKGQRDCLYGKVRPSFERFGPSTGQKDAFLMALSLANDTKHDRFLSDEVN